MNFLPLAMSWSRLTATNVTLPSHFAASLSHAGSSFLQGLHHEPPNVITTQPPRSDSSFHSLPAASLAPLGSGARSPSLTSAAAPLTRPSASAAITDARRADIVAPWTAG